MTKLCSLPVLRAILLVLCALPMLLLPQRADAADAGLPGQVVAKLFSSADRASVQSRYRLQLLRQLGPRPIYLFRTPVGVDPNVVVTGLRGDARVDFAERNFVVQEPEARKRAVWAIGRASVYQTQWAPARLRLGEAQQFATGHGVTVAVLDTGADYTHPALASRLLPGVDFVDGDLDASETGTRLDAGFGHGTHVAGLVALFAPEARIWPLRVLDARGRGNIWSVSEALLHAANPDGLAATGDHAHVINLSLGTTAPTELLDKVVELVTCSDDDEDEDNDDYSDPGFAVDRERCNLHHGSVVVAAAGNGGSATELQFPAAERAEGALAVAASNVYERLATFSNRGPWISIAAPGAGITSTVPGGGYGVWNGTSMAAPIVAGIAALVRQANPDWKPVDITRRLLDRAAPLCGSVIPRVDAHGAVFDQVPASPACP